MKDNEERILALIDNLNTVKRFKHLSVYLKKHNIENKFGVVAKKLDILQKISGGWEFIAGEPNMKMVDDIIKGLNAHRYYKDVEDVPTLEYKILRNKAMMLGATSNAPVAEMAFKLGNGNARVGLRELKRKPEQR